MQLFDSHFHIIDNNFPLISNQGYLPHFYSTKDYLQETKEYELRGGAIVSGSFQGFDQKYLIDALKKLGPRYVGVTQLPHTTSDETLVELHQKGVRAVRFNLKRGGSEKVEYLADFSKRIYSLLNWHIELYIESKNIKSIRSIIDQCPKVSIDHLGLTQKGFEDLLDLVKSGIKVKATGFSRSNFSVEHMLERIHAQNPNALLFGTDLPSTRAPQRFSTKDIQLIQKIFDKANQKKIFYQNAEAFYGL